MKKQQTRRPLQVSQRGQLQAAGILQRKCACGQFTGGGTCEGCKRSEGMLQRHPPSASGASAAATIGASQPAVTTSQSSAEPGPATVDVLNRAAAESGRSIHEPLRSRLGEQFGQDFTQVRVHSGPASADAAQRVGARAYTLGTDIHLSREARGLSGRDLDQLLAHEAVHTVQQGGHAVTPHAALTVSHPADAAEQEAERLAESITSGAATQKPSRSLALRDRMRASMPGQVGRSVSPHIQRDLVGKHPTREGEFDLDMKTQSDPTKDVGMGGTIKFRANDKGPDSGSIRLLQVAKTVDMATGKDSVWTGGEARRMQAMTKASPGVEPGFFVDQLYGELKPRTKKADKRASPYYIDTGHLDKATNKDGSKKGKVITEASLFDTPESSSNMRFSFETVAKASDTGHVYGTIMWGFDITDVAKGKVEHERAVGRNLTLLSTDKAIEKFDQVFKNPGAPTAP